ncbi:MAG: IS110 family transposase, partial [Desulfobulbaceae bacterium]|nr:IS110 family transposase [Desulfobulbaceae bacterium]
MLDEADKVVYQKKLANDLDLILQQLAIFINDIVAIAIESTFNWYWLVDGLKAAGYEVKLVNTAAVQTYSGLKHTDDKDDARWLAHLLRLGILPTGYIYPKEERAVRDLLRKRSQLVRQSTTNILSAQNILTRNTTQSLTAAKLKKIADEEINKLFDDPNITLALKSNINIIKSLQTSIKEIEQVVVSQVKLRPEYQQLLSVSGIGQALGLTIMLETGEISRFNKVGNYSSYCRCVKSERLSNGKKKGENNRKNGNKYLAWAFIEAANFAIRYNDKIKAFYQKKKAKTNGVIAT